MALRRILLVAFAVTLTFVQEQLLMFLPNIQFTVLLMFVFVSVLRYKEMFVYILVYVILDNMFFGFDVFNIIAMIIAWNIIPLTYHIILRKSENEFKLAMAAFIFGFVYGWIFIPFRMVQTGIYSWVFFMANLSADITFEVVMAVCGFVTVYWLYQPLRKVTLNYMEKQHLQASKSFK